MFYTAQEIEERIEEIATPFVKVEVDGAIVGCIYKDDLLYSLRRTMRRDYIYQGRDNRLKEIFIYGRKYPIAIGINVYPASSQDLWRRMAQQERSEKEKAERDASNVRPLVTWDAYHGIIHIEEGGKCKKIDREKPKRGFWRKVRGWLRGDIGFRK